LPAGVELGEEIPQKASIGFPAVEVPAAAQHQRLIEGHFKAVLALLHVAVLVGFAGLDRLSVEAVVGHQGCRAASEPFFAVQGLHRRGKGVGAVLLGDPA